MTNEEDPLIQALPPATDYLTYLTLLEYQLTPARLPTLHRLLQDEVLTTNIGWDLVQLLLPMLPQSLDCLQDVARLGNPREVILRVSDALMNLEADDDDDEVESRSGSQPDESTPTSTDRSKHATEATSTPPRHIMQFNCLVAMLAILHSRIQTKSPSRFLATSLQAVLEAYPAMPTSETTIALLEFLRDVSPTKRPAPPPRAASESTVLRVSEASAPDPEAEIQSPSPRANNESALVKRFLQFGLIELLKSYLLSLSSPVDPGMSWAIRVYEKIYPQTQMPGKKSQIEIYANDKHLRERDMIMAKITALSTDFGLNDQQLLTIVSRAADDQPAPLDFDDPPKEVEEIPLERHGSLLLLAARAAMAELFTSGTVASVSVYPDLARIYSNFIGEINTPDEIAFGQPQPLLDSLLALTVLALRNPSGIPADDQEFANLVLAVTACTARQTYSAIRQLPEVIVHTHPSQAARFKIIRKVLEDDRWLTVKDRAVGWLKKEILATPSSAEPADEMNIFLNPHYFSVLFPLIFNASNLLLDVSDDIVPSFVRFSQTLAPSIHAALSLYYILISSPTLRTQLQLVKTHLYFRNRFFTPLKTLCRAFEADLLQNGGKGRIEAALGEETCQIAMARSVGLIAHVVEQVEDAVGSAFAQTDLERQEPSADDIARVDAIRKETVL